MYGIVNKGLNNLNGVYSGVTRHNIKGKSCSTSTYFSNAELSEKPEKRE
jgi:hypothetical protein